MVIDDVQDDFDAGAMQVYHHRFEFLHLAPGDPAGAVPRVRSKVTDAIVPPVVAHTAICQNLVIYELVDRQETAVIPRSLK